MEPILDDTRNGGYPALSVSKLVCSYDTVPARHGEQLAGVQSTGKPKEEKSMSNLIVISFDDEHTAFAMRAELVRMQKEYLIEMGDVVVVTKDDMGEVNLHQAQNLTAAGAISGGFWGMLIGVIFLNPLLGAAVGAGAGAVSGALTDLGISNDFMYELGAGFKPGCSALFVLVRKATKDKVLEGLSEFTGKGKVLQTSLTKDKEDELRAVIEGAT